MIDVGALLSAALLGGVVSFLATRAAARVARRLRLLDHPQDYKAHAAPTPLLGGLGVVAGTLAGVGWSLSRVPGLDLGGLAAIGVGALVMAAAGLFDDLRGLSPGVKFAWQIAATVCAGLCLAALGVRLRLFLPWSVLPIALLTALWVVAITNAMTFLDNMNGLCAGLGALAAASLAIANFRSGEPTAALAAAALGGACLGFLPDNWPRARIFLGDAGSMFIGFSLAALSVMGVYTRGAELPAVAVLAPLVVLAIPVLDLLLVAALRLRAGHPVWLGDRRHLSHRLVARGMRPSAAVAVLWGAGGACGMAALLLPTLGAAEVALLLTLVAGALIALVAAAGARGLP